MPGKIKDKSFTPSDRDKYLKIVKFLRQIANNPPCMIRSINAVKLLKELGENLQDE